MPGARPLRADLIRAYLGLVVGLLLGLTAEVTMAQYDAIHGLITVYVAPLVFLVLFFMTRPDAFPAATGRCLGAYGAWLALWFTTGVTFSLSYQYGGSLLALAMLAVMFVAFVPAGVVLGERIQSRILSATTWRG